jgi:hypothetical protein
VISTHLDLMCVGSADVRASAPASRSTEDTTGKGWDGPSPSADEDVVVTPDDLVVVGRSWAELRLRDGDLVDRLAASFSVVAPPEAARRRAQLLYDAVAELVDLLTAPSQLGVRARQLFETWPDPCSSPSFRVDGQAWIDAARDVGQAWSVTDERAWRHAWLLLSDVLAEESLSPFAGPPHADAPT